MSEHKQGKKAYSSNFIKSQFKKGNRPPRWLPVGSERLNRFGYREVKTGEPNKWKCRHILIWEEANGKVPKGRVVMFLDGDRANIRLENLLLVSRAELMAMNRHGLIYSNAEFTKIGKLIGDAKIILNMRSRRKKISLGEIKKKITGI